MSAGSVGGWQAADFNGSDDEEEALRVAIALSLGEDPGNSKTTSASNRRGTTGAPGETIDLTQDEDDYDDSKDGRDHEQTRPRRTPHTEDKNDTNPAPSIPLSPIQPIAPAPESSGVPSTNLSALLGLDRKKMEAERLARLNKRKASELSPPAAGSGGASRPPQRSRVTSPSRSKVVPVTAGGTEGPQRKALELRVGASIESAAPTIDIVSSSSTVPPPSSTLGPHQGTSTHSSSSSTTPPFPQGVVKKTWAYKQPRRGDDIKIEEVLQKDKLQLAVISSWQWDDEWMVSKININRTKLILVAYARDEAQREAMRDSVPRDRIRFCFPPMSNGGMGVMHSKLMLLKYEAYMRIVVPTANFVPYDWGEMGGTMENMVFIIDLPKFETAEQRETQVLPSFGEDLLYFLQAKGLDEKLISSLRNYDFSETSRYGFVHSIAGTHSAEDAWKRTGYCGLGRIVDALGLGTRDLIEVDYVCASIGAVNESLLTSLYFACQGDSGLKEYEARVSGRKGTSSRDEVGSVQDHARVYFPSQATVEESLGGIMGAGTICFQSKWWKAATFPHKVLRDCRSVRTGMVMHTKVIFVRPSTAEGKARGFAYVGSANLSESAWGRLVKDRSSGKPKLTCRNWECGVIISTSDSAVEATGETREAFGMFDGLVPIPMKIPGGRLEVGSQDTARIPWFSRES
ncbi:tyrosyl-DNA phosphodiesterase-domain-containing protein [Podospora australis]|uniref:Tyrosyl-DNA phosphodiesterase-domain-containing protein n=1 Tax=Podospora australis TaxID=1536484 RepID=A0AAN7AHJ5_9PEZI|nr:tyrosyl-DNA phosphodiesterase-domain-containing protein [Podospora australis]